MIQPSLIPPDDENALELGYAGGGQTREVADLYLWWPGPRLASWPGLSVARTPN